jgi:hypothetical protein
MGRKFNSLGFKPQAIEKQKHSNIVYEISADKSFFYAGAADAVWAEWSLTDAI